MENLEDRVSLLEGRVMEQSMRIDDVREAVSRLEVRIGSLEERFDRRFELLEHRLDQRFAVIDLRFAGIDKRLDSMDYKFGWFIGIGIAVLLGVFGQWLRP